MIPKPPNGDHSYNGHWYNKDGMRLDDVTGAPMVGYTDPPSSPPTVVSTVHAMPVAPGNSKDAKQNAELSQFQRDGGLHWANGILYDKTNRIVSADHQLTRDEVNTAGGSAADQVLRQREKVDELAVMTKAEQYAAGFLPPTATLISPIQGQFIKGTISVKIKTAAVGAMESVLLLLDGRVYATLKPVTPDMTGTLVASSIPNGVHAISVCAVDPMGRQGLWSSAQVTVDNLVSSTPKTPVKPVNSLPDAAALPMHAPAPIAAQVAPVPTKIPTLPVTPVSGGKSIPNTAPIDLPTIGTVADTHVSPYVDPLDVFYGSGDAYGENLPPLAGGPGTTTSTTDGDDSSIALGLDGSQLMMALAVLLLVGYIIVEYGE